MPAHVIRHAAQRLRGDVARYLRSLADALDQDEILASTMRLSQLRTLKHELPGLRRASQCALHNRRRRTRR
jgi:hypothetical protein